MGYTAKEFEQLQANRHGKPALPNDVNTAPSAQQSAKDEHDVDQSKKSRRSASNEAQRVAFIADFIERCYPGNARQTGDNVVEILHTTPLGKQFLAVVTVKLKP